VRYETLAAISECHAPSVYRLLRALASVGVFTETSPGCFGLTPLAGLLRAAAPDSMRALAMVYNEESYRAWGDMLYAVQTGRPAFDRVYGVPAFEYFGTHPEANAVFNAAMIDWTKRVAGAVVGAYDFSGFGTVVDVGGGHGALLTEILRSHRKARGILWLQTPERSCRRRASLIGARLSAATSSKRYLQVAMHMCSRRSCTIGTTSRTSRS